MSKESERIFGATREISVGSAEADYFEGRLDAFEQLFFAAFDFLKDPSDTERIPTNPHLSRLAKEVLVLEDNIEIMPNTRADLELPIVHDLGYELVQVQLPHDYLELADSSPAEVLFFAVWMGSKIRDHSLGWELDNPDSDQRALILQSEFLQWWEDVAPQIGAFTPENEAFDAVRTLYPKGVESRSAKPYLPSLEVRRIGPLTSTFEPMSQPQTNFHFLIPQLRVVSSI